MRFDDRLATIASFPRADAGVTAASWRQLVDLLAQTPAGDPDPLSPAMRERLRSLRAQVPLAVRVGAMAMCAGRRVHPALILFAIDDGHPVAAAAIGRAMLDDVAWLGLLPRMPAGLRATLRGRGDLSALVRVGLACFGPSDLALPAPAGDTRPGGGEARTVADPSETIPGDADVPPSDEAPPAPNRENPVTPMPESPPPSMPSPEADAERPPATVSNAGAAPDAAAAFETRPPDLGGRRMPSAADNADDAAGDASVAAMLARIAAFRRDGPPPAPPPVDAFRFETGPDGVIGWAEGASRAALGGVTLARAARFPVDGVEARVASAFHDRTAFRDARLMLRGEAPMGGAWSIAGVPSFDPWSGRFTGYRGVARRLPAPARSPDAGLFDTGLAADGLRQLVHELRTPLNAIIGFGEMVGRQMLGPAPTAYRAQALAIVDHGRRLLDVVADIDIATAMDRHVAPSDAHAVPVATLRRIWAEHRAMAMSRGVIPDLAISDDGSRIAAHPADVERVFARLTATVIGFGRAGETITADLSVDPAGMSLSLDRPAILDGLREAELLDPGFAPEGDRFEVPPLGLGFALRLVRSLAAKAGGSLAIGPRRFVLRLPGGGARSAAAALR